MSDLITDLAAETEVLEGLLTGIPAHLWDLPTPAQGWAIRDQVSHLAFFDDMTILAMTDPQRFRVEADAHIAGGMDFPDRLALEQRAILIPALREWFSVSRRTLLTEAAARDPGERVPWYGPAMSLASSITARLMETWAHGQDVADALGVRRVPTARLRHVAHLGVRAMPYSYAVRGLEVPQVPVRVELTAPDGSDWSWGPEDAADRVSGTALDFALVVTQRRHRSDTALFITGPVAQQWMSIAQAFAGAAGPGRPQSAGSREPGQIRTDSGPLLAAAEA